MNTPTPSSSASVEAMKEMIAYFYLLSYCPPEGIGPYQQALAPMRQKMAEKSGRAEKDYFRQAYPEACWRMVAFHQATRLPEAKYVDRLVETGQSLGEKPANWVAFQTLMAEIAVLPGRAKPENRLHRNKGCKYCAAPCRYGYFSLVSEPQFSQLQEMLALEVQKPAADQSPWKLVKDFTLSSLTRLTGLSENPIHIEHLANLSYCLLLLSMAKSRMVLPDEQLRRFQSANQAYILSRVGKNS
jgi:hypothetical protein